MAAQQAPVYGMAFEIAPRDLHRPPDHPGTIREVYLLTPERTSETFAAAQIPALVERIAQIEAEGGRVYALDLHLLLATILWAQSDAAHQLYQSFKGYVTRGVLLSLDIAVERTQELFGRPVVPGLNAPVSALADVQVRGNVIDIWARRQGHPFAWPGPLGIAIDTFAQTAITVIGWKGCRIDRGYLTEALEWAAANAPDNPHQKSVHDNFRNAAQNLCDDGRFHPHYRQTITLRFAASSPAIQAFASRVSLPFVPRGLIIPDTAEHVIASIDMRSAELFALGHVWRRWYADEENGSQLLADLVSQFDTPGELGKLILEEMPDATPKLIHEAGKYAGFASINLSRPTMISKRLIVHFGCPTATFEAVQRGLRWYKKRYPIDRWHRDAKERRDQPYVVTPGGRAVKTGNPSETGGRIFQSYLAEAQAMALLALVENGVTPILQLHDEIILSTHPDEIARATEIYTHTVANHMGGEEGLRVRVKTATDRWSNLTN